MSDLETRVRRLEQRVELLAAPSSGIERAFLETLPTDVLRELVKELDAAPGRPDGMVNLAELGPAGVETARLYATWSAE
jgi:hypothetical protein